ncbi:MAG: hypothetical protein NWE92_01550 [Candidatus Bathyarchaeota archaeon]|nr:hypothetical protein [Candidatus Bathyarchaeota archaeon]
MKEKDTRIGYVIFTIILLLTSSSALLQVQGADSPNLYWNIEILTLSGSTADITRPSHGETSIDVDSAGNVHITYASVGSKQCYATKTEAGWSHTQLDSTSFSGVYSSVAVGSDGLPQISYYTHEYTLKYLKWNGLNWDSTVVDSSGKVGEWNDIALDSNGYPHISYGIIFPSNFSSHLKYAKLTDSGWRTGTLDYSDNVGDHTSIALDSSGYEHISYYDDFNKDLKFAHQTNLGLFEGTVDWTGDVGQYSALALTSDGQPCICYYDETNTQLKLAKGTSTGWDISVIDNSGDVGEYCSLALDSEDHPHVCYWDDTNNLLKYASWDEGWTYYTVDSMAGYGEYIDMTLDDNDIPHIVYVDIGIAKLKYATLIGSVTTATGSGKAHISSSDGEISQFSAIPEETLPTEGKPAVSFPHGLFSFTISDLEPHQTVTVEIVLPSAIPPGSQYWKYHEGTGWFEVPLGDNDGDNVITLTLTDGEDEDADGVANGVIVDPGGPSMPSVMVVPETAFGTTLIGIFAAALCFALIKTQKSRKQR